MNTMKGVAGRLVVLGGIFVSLPVQAEWITYSVHEGVYTNAAIWRQGYVPTNTTQYAQINTGNRGDFRFTLTDWQEKSSNFQLMVYPGSTLVLDGAGAVFEKPALGPDEGEYIKDPTPISLQTGSSVPNTKLITITAQSGYSYPYTERFFRWTDALFAVTNTSDNDVSVTFSRGTFDFSGSGNSANRLMVNLGSGWRQTDNNHELIRSSAFNFNDVTSRFGCVQLGGGQGKLEVDYNVCGGTFEIAENLYFAGSSHLTLKDGAVLSAKRVMRLNASQPLAKLSADDAVYEARATVTSGSTPFIGQLDVAELGAKGLTVRAGSYEVSLWQDFTDMTGQAGRLILEGDNRIHVAKNSHQSVLDSRAANLVFTADVTDYAATVVVTNGTVVNFAASTALELGGLTLGNGVQVYVNPATRLTVGALSLGDASVILASAFANGTYPLVTVRGNLAVAVREAWQTLPVGGGRSVNKSYRFICGDYDSANDVTVLSLVVADAYEPTVTDAADVPVPIDSLLVLGALAFTDAKDHVLSGSNRIFFEDSGHASISVLSGSQEIAVPTLLSALTKIDVAGGATLTFSKPIAHGGVDKTGTGVLAFGADAASELPLGLTLRDGTWKVEAEGERTAGALKIQSPNPSNAVVLATATDTTVAGLTVPSGAVVKTGVGALTVENESAKMQLYGDGSIHGKLQYGISLPAGPMDFPADGTPPTQNYSAFNIVEGEMVLRGTGAEEPTSASQYFSTEEVFVGMRSPLDVQSAPGLVIDHARVDLGSTQRHVFIAANPVATDISGEAANPYLVISNKAEVLADGIVVGTSCDDDGLADVYPAVTVDNAALKVTCRRAHSFLTLSGGKACHTSFVLRNASTLETADLAVRWWGDAEVDVDDGSVFTKYADGACAIELGKSARGAMTVRDGSTLRCASVALKSGEKLVSGNRVDFAFDGGYLDPAADAFAFSALPSGAHLVALAGGLKLAVPAGGTWTLPAIVEGSGPIVACGEGAVALDGAFTNAFAGAGVFTGGTLRKATVKIAVDDAGAVVGGVPTFDGAAYDGRLTIDLGRTAENPIDLATIRDLTVMKYATTAPAAANLGKLVGTGLPKAYGKFRVEDGKVILESAADSRGMVLIFR